MSTSENLPVLNDATPTTPDELHTWIRKQMGITLPRKAMISGHSAPFEFLAHAFLAPAGHSTHALAADSVLWAARGAGKTFLGALLVFLDLVFRPGINVQILSGSLAQAVRLFAHLKQFIVKADVEDKIRGKVSRHAITMVNGSHVEVLAQSETSIRGTRVQRIICDEVDLFTPELFDAAQLVTRSAVCGEETIQGSVICLSTLHRPQGTMSRLVADCANGTRTLFKWSVIDALEKCSAERACSAMQPSPDAGAIPLPVLDPLPVEACPLHNECQGRAKHLDAAESGHFYIADAITLKARVSDDTWRAEMLCQGVSRADAVYKDFDRDSHVLKEIDIEAQFRIGWMGVRDPNLSLVCGMDFGLRNPTVVLWGILDRASAGLPVLYIVDELRTVGIGSERNAERIARGLSNHTTAATRWQMPSMVLVDPSGKAHRSNSSNSDCDHLQNAGLRTVGADNAVEAGVREVQGWMAPASGKPRLLVHARCEQIIADLLMYRYPPHLPHSRIPMKDGTDHGCDALRYLVMGVSKASKPTERTTYA